MRAGLLLVLGLGRTSCTRPCRDETVLITVTLAGPAADADALAVTVQIGGGTSSTFTAPVPAGTTSGTIEVTFPSGYPAGQTVSTSIELLGTSGNPTVVKGHILGDGQIGSFEASTAHLSPDGSAGGAPLHYAHALVGNYLYVFGSGYHNACSTPVSARGRVVQRASLQAGGTISAFTQVNEVNYTAPGRIPALAMIADKVYAIGGQLTGGADIEVAPLGPDGKLQTFETVIRTLKTPRAGAAAAVVGDRLLANGRVFVAGNSGDVSSAPYDNSGTITAAFVKTSNGYGPPMGRTAATVGSGFLTIGGFSGLSGSESIHVGRVLIPATGNLGGHHRLGRDAQPPPLECTRGRPRHAPVGFRRLDGPGPGADGVGRVALTPARAPCLGRGA